MLKGIFLDDERKPTDVTWINYPDNVDWVVVRTKTEFCNADFKDCDIISFDHDLAVDSFTGYDAVKFLVSYLMDNSWCKVPSHFKVHSMNPVGAKNIQAYWDNYLTYRLVGNQYYDIKN